MSKYVHGYAVEEWERLSDQANTLAGLIHKDIRFPAGTNLLEAGCGTGAQTIHLAKNNPEINITSIDISQNSLSSAEKKIQSERISNVVFRNADIFNPPFKNESFDHIFICFVEEISKRS